MKRAYLYEVEHLYDPFGHGVLHSSRWLHWFENACDAFGEVMSVPFPARVLRYTVWDDLPALTAGIVFQNLDPARIYDYWLGYLVALGVMSPREHVGQFLSRIYNPEVDRWDSRIEIRSISGEARIINHSQALRDYQERYYEVSELGFQVINTSRIPLYLLRRKSD